jgi:hypothetical protein
VAIGYTLAAPATVTVRVYDGNHFLLATLEDGVRYRAGRRTTFWNGRDDDGTLLPAEAYYFTMNFRYDDGREMTYDPSFHGGKYLGTIFTHVDVDGGKIAFTLPEPAWVRMRAGIHKGPLRKTLLDWEPLGAGSHVIEWNGMDEAGVENILKSPSLIVNPVAYTLPPHGVIIEKSPVEYVSYWEERARRKGQPPMEYMKISDDARAAATRSRIVA